MSLVGSDINIDTRRSQSRSLSPEGSRSRSMSPQPHSDDDDLDDYPSISPARPAESLFLSGLSAQNISAAELAQHIHQSHRSKLSTATSVSSIDDFATAAVAPDEQSFFTSSYTPLSSNASSVAGDFETDQNSLLFPRDTLAYSRNVIQEESESNYEDIINMSNVNTNLNTNQQQELEHLDAAEKVYGTAKGVWSWGKGLFFARPFLGMAEGIAGKVVSITGHSLSDVDGAVINQLHGLDKHILNPTVEQIVGIIMAAAGKTEEIFKPVVHGILKPIGLIKEKAEVAKDKVITKINENPELTTIKNKVVS